MKYIRVETYNNHKKITHGGFFSAILTVLALKLGVPPTFDVAELESLINKSEDPGVTELMQVMGTLCGLPYPEEYIKDKEGHVLEDEKSLGDSNSSWSVGLSH